jgi:hypothetical protein
MVPIMEKSASSMANEWEEKVKDGGGCVELEVSHYMANVTADIIAHTAFGSSYEKGRKVFEHQLSLFNLTFQRLIFLTIPGYRFFQSFFLHCLKSFSHIFTYFGNEYWA